MLAPLLASFESNFGKKRAAPWVGSRPENVYGLTSLLSMVCSDWQEAVRALQSDLRTVDAGFYGFPGCKQGLVSLVASKGLDSAALRVLARACPNLRTATLFTKRPLPRDAKSPPETDPGLTISDASVQALLRACPHLEEITLLGTWRIGPAVLLTAARHCPQLRCVTLRYCAWIPTRVEMGDAAFAAVTNHISYYASRLTAASLVSLCTVSAAVSL